MAALWCPGLAVLCLLAVATFGGAAAALKIPRILHHIYLSGADHLVLMDSLGQHVYPPQWAEECAEVHQGWKRKYWDYVEAKTFVQQHYPDLMPVFSNFRCPVSKGDLLRYLVLYHYGGKFLDMDVQCYRLDEDMLEDYDMVLQMHTPEEGVSNAALAAVPRHPILWAAIAQVNSTARQWNLCREELEEVSTTTGARMMATVVGKMVGKDLFYKFDEVAMSVQHLVDNPSSAVMFYPVHTWYLPCTFNDRRDCVLEFDEQLQSHRPAALKQVAGMHHWRWEWVPN